MKKVLRVLFITNYPAPYRVDFFNLLGEQVKLTVAFTETPEEQKHRSEKWFNSNYSGFQAVFLHKKVSIGKLKVFKDIFQLLKSGFDYIVLGGYSSGTQVAAIEYMRVHKIPFTIEIDGGIIRSEAKSHYIIKKHLVSSASAWLSSGRAATSYLMHYGADPQKIIIYPLTSQNKRDMPGENLQLLREKARKHLQIEEKYMVLSVGQMIRRKGFDVLLKSATGLSNEIGVYIVGGDPSEEYLRLADKLCLENVHFVGFKNKTELAEYYCAADLFVMPTREDIWGLVVGEAMSYGLPIISTDQCMAALELVENNVNGMIVPVENPKALADAIEYVLNGDYTLMGQRSRQRIQEYTI